jgi:hypothetical protein
MKPMRRRYGEIMMSSSISIHIPFIAKIIDFLVLFFLPTHSEEEIFLSFFISSELMRESENERIFPSEKILVTLCEWTKKKGALNIYSWRCVLIFSNEAMTSIVPPFSAAVNEESNEIFMSGKVMENTLIIGLL